MQRFYSPSMNGFYSDDIHRTARDRPADCIPISHDEWQKLLNENAAGSDIVYENGQLFTRARQITMHVIRSKRNKLLLASDWSQLADVPDAIKQEWAAYRQQLRDIPATYEGRPEQVVWPTKPS